MDPARATSDPLTTAWPRPAQLVVAFLLGVGSTLLTVRLVGQPPPRPLDVLPGPPVNVNRAGRGELEQLPGVGPVLANRIVERRDAQGPFATADDLRTVPGVGPGTLAKLRRYAATDLPPDGDAMAQSSPTKRKAADEPLDVNAADAAQLQTLPGIGPKMAERIVGERARRPFVSVDDLRRVAGIGPKTLEKLRPLVRVGPNQTRDAP